MMRHSESAVKTMYETILVGFDESNSSKAALSEAAHWIKRHGGNIILVHAVYFDEEEFGIAPDQLDRRLKVGEKVCIQARETLMTGFGIEADSLLCEGDPPEVILDIAKGKKADLIVLGTYGRKGLKRLLMGSVTSQVIVNAPTDVLVVKKPCTECSGAYRSILVPYDGSASSERALERACHLSKIDNAEITALYVIPRYEEMVEFFRTSSIQQSLHLEAEKIIDKARKLALGEGVSVKRVIKEGDAGDKIIETADLEGNDLVVMGTCGWKGMNRAIMGSSTERAIIHATCPVLVVR
ncbi:MAG TPA: universal stress protein [Thermodesulfovibrionales bacterium]|nr:universal stress protein [Thermodesulfovibrionales bacterium]